MSAKNLKRVGIASALCGIVLLLYNLFNYEPAFSGITSRGAYYETEAKIGIAIGAVLIAGGVFAYIEGRKKAASG
jgi:hypothetical protein